MGAWKERRTRLPGGLASELRPDACSKEKEGEKFFYRSLRTWGRKKSRRWRKSCRHAYRQDLPRGGKKKKKKRGEMLQFLSAARKEKGVGGRGVMAPGPPFPRGGKEKKGKGGSPLFQKARRSDGKKKGGKEATFSFFRQGEDSRRQRRRGCQSLPLPKREKKGKGGKREPAGPSKDSSCRPADAFPGSGGGKKKRKGGIARRSYRDRGGKEISRERLTGRDCRSSADLLVPGKRRKGKRAVLHPRFHQGGGKKKKEYIVYRG